MTKLLETRSWKFDPKKGGRALKRLMGQRGVTQDDLSDATGIPKSIISRYCNGGTERPSLEHIIKIYGALSLSPLHAVQDFGINIPTEPVSDHRMEELNAMISLYSGSKEKQNELIEMLWVATRVFTERNKRPA